MTRGDDPAPPAPPAAPSSVADAGAEVRTTVLTGDRLCLGCGYNLVGQRVLREPHHGLLIVRCPECATVASVQEYPLLGRWANRWGAILAALWFIFLLGAWPGSSAVLFGWSVAAAEESASSYRQHLVNLHEAAQPATPGAPAAATTTLPGPGGTITITPGGVFQTGPGLNPFGPWWQQQDSDAILAAAGGWRGAYDATGLLLWIPETITAFVVGWFWSIALLQVRRRWLLLVAAAILGLTTVFAGIALADWMMDPVRWAWDAAQRQVGAPVLALSVAYAVVPLTLGLLLGRPLTRLAVRALLPPRLRSSLALLWTAEGLDVPGVPAR